MLCFLLVSLNVALHNADSHLAVLFVGLFYKYVFYSVVGICFNDNVFWTNTLGIKMLQQYQLKIDHWLNACHHKL